MEQNYKQIKTKIIFKHETEENWKKSSYVPEQGEQVFVDFDDTHPYQRVKRGDGIHKVCELPDIEATWGEFVDLNIGKWVPNGDHEEYLINKSGRRKIRELDTNNPIDFEDGDLSDEDLEITVPNAATQTSTHVGNLRDDFEVISDSNSKVLKIHSDFNYVSSYPASVMKINLTDSATKETDDITKGKYLVLDFDIKFIGDFPTIRSTKPILDIRTREFTSESANWLSNIVLQSYGDVEKLKVNGNTIYRTYDEFKDKWISFRCVTELATEPNSNNNYVAVGTIFYKEKDTPSLMTKICTNRRPVNAEGNIGGINKDIHDVIFTPAEVIASYTYCLDNISFIRTDDDSYIHSDCQHEFTESWEESVDVTKKTFTRYCTKGCGYAEHEYIPIPVNLSKIANYNSTYMSAEANMLPDTILSCGTSSVLTNKHIIFTADIESFNTIRIGHGYTEYTANFLEIDGLTIKHYFRNSKDLTKDPELLNTFEHGLNISNNVKVRVDVNSKRLATITLESNGVSKVVKTSTTWCGVGKIQVNSMTSTLRNAQIAYTCDEYGSDVHFYGDSYLSQSKDRWLHYAINDGYTRALFDGYSGECSGAAIDALKANFDRSDPSTIVWMMGMNDGPDTDINNPSSAWTTNRDNLIALSKEFGFEIIFTTIPTVPTINHEAKNKWIRESGYRYIDMAKAVIDENTGEWKEGYLNTNDPDEKNHVHPTEEGAQAIYAQVKKDFPEIEYLK